MDLQDGKVQGPTFYYKEEKENRKNREKVVPTWVDYGEEIISSIQLRATFVEDFFSLGPVLKPV